MTPRHMRALATILDRVAEPGSEIETIFLSDEVERWPAGAVETLVAAKLLEVALPADSITCRGCEERCRRPVTIVEASEEAPPSANSTCHLHVGLGPLEHDVARLRRWTSNRKMVSGFFARMARAAIVDHDTRWRRTRYKALQAEGLRRAASLELDGAASVVVGTRRVPLIELILWDGRELSIDSDALICCLRASEDVQSGSKRYQPSRTIQEDNKILTEIHAQRVQRRLNALAQQHPKLNKEALAKKLALSDQGEGMSWARIARVTRMPGKKGRRKNFA